MTAQQIKILAIKLDISVAEIARQYGDTPQNFWKKMKRETFTPEELAELAKKLDIGYESHFILESGEKI